LISKSVICDLPCDLYSKGQRPAPSSFTSMRRQSTAQSRPGYHWVCGLAPTGDVTRSPLQIPSASRTTRIRAGLQGKRAQPSATARTCAPDAVSTHVGTSSQRKYFTVRVKVRACWLSRPRQPQLHGFRRAMIRRFAIDSVAIIGSSLSARNVRDLVAAVVTHGARCLSAGDQREEECECDGLVHSLTIQDRRPYASTGPIYFFPSMNPAAWRGI